MKVCLWNVENLFILSDTGLTADHLKLDETQWQKLSVSLHPNKSLKKTFAIANILKELDADLVMLCEVGGQESLKNFNEHFLRDQNYATALIEGNSDRHIDVGFLIKKSLPCYFDLSTNKNRLIQFLYSHERHLGMEFSRKFSRDVAELKLFTKDRENPFLLVLLTHLKSHLDPEGIDFSGRERREAELKALVDIHLELLKKFPKTPQMVCGDFNGFAGRPNTDKEFLDLHLRTQLVDVLDIAQVPLDKRFSHLQFRTNQKTDGKQIDFSFLTPDLSPLLKANSGKMYRFRDEYGFEQDLPQTLDAKFLLPSDHYPLIFELEKIQVW